MRLACILNATSSTLPLTTHWAWRGRTNAHPIEQLSALRASRTFVDRPLMLPRQPSLESALKPRKGPCSRPDTAEAVIHRPDEIRVRQVDWHGELTFWPMRLVGVPEVVLMSSGSEVGLVLDAQKKLKPMAFVRSP